VAHELAHIVQQRQAGGAATHGRFAAEDSAAEREADQLAPRAAAGDRVEVRAAPAAGLHRVKITNKNLAVRFGSNTVETNDIVKIKHLKWIRSNIPLKKGEQTAIDLRIARLSGYRRLPLVRDARGLGAKKRQNAYDGKMKGKRGTASSGQEWIPKKNLTTADQQYLAEGQQGTSHQRIEMFEERDRAGEVRVMKYRNSLGQKQEERFTPCAYCLNWEPLPRIENDHVAATANMRDHLQGAADEATINPDYRAFLAYELKTQGQTVDDLFLKKTDKAGKESLRPRSLSMLNYHNNPGNFTASCKACNNPQVKGNSGVADWLGKLPTFGSGFLAQHTPQPSTAEMTDQSGAFMGSAIDQHRRTTLSQPMEQMWDLTQTRLGLESKVRKPLTETQPKKKRRLEQDASSRLEVAKAAALLPGRVEDSEQVLREISSQLSVPLYGPDELDKAYDEGYDEGYDKGYQAGLAAAKALSAGKKASGGTPVKTIAPAKTGTGHGGASPKAGPPKKGAKK
jgi:hypothetical protein